MLNGSVMWMFSGSVVSGCAFMLFFIVLPNESLEKRDSVDPGRTCRYHQQYLGEGRGSEYFSEICVFQEMLLHFHQ